MDPCSLYVEKQLRGALDPLRYPGRARHPMRLVTQSTIRLVTSYRKKYHSMSGASHIRGSHPRLSYEMEEEFHVQHFLFILLFYLIYSREVGYYRYEAGVAQWLERRVCKHERRGFESRRRAEYNKNILFGGFLGIRKWPTACACLDVEALKCFTRSCAAIKTASRQLSW